MLQIALARWKQGHRTVRFPDQVPALPDRFRGLPVIDPARSPDASRESSNACTNDAIDVGTGAPRLDLGRCLFCAECVQACAEGAITFSQDYRMAARTRDDLVLRGAPPPLARALDEKARRLFGRSL